jgi:hypothetical protein
MGTVITKEIILSLFVHFSLRIVVQNIWNKADSAQPSNSSTTEYHFPEKRVQYTLAVPMKVLCQILMEEKDGGCKRNTEGSII